MHKKLALWMSNLFSSSLRYAACRQLPPAHPRHVSMTRTVLPLVAALFVASLFVGTADANDYAVGPSATGNGSGSDWNNIAALSTLNMARGHTYFLRDGSYSARNFSTANSGTTYITIKKAIESDHGPATGWQSSYGDEQVIFTGGISITTSYWIIDGNDKANYGIRINYADGNNSSYTIGLNIDRGDYVTCRSIHVDGGSSPHNDRGNRIAGSNITLSHMQNSNGGKDAHLLISASDILYEDIWTHTANPAPGEHDDAWELQGTVSNVTWRYCRTDWSLQQIFWGGLSPDFNGFYIYGNSFTSPLASPGGGNVALKNRDPGLTPINNLYVYNNTFEGLNNALELGLGTGDIRNNIIFGTTTSPAFGNCTHDYNFFGSGYGSVFGEAHGQAGGDLFMNSLTNNYRLSAATNAGDSSIGATYATDPNGNSRGADGVWDRGAYEYVSDGPPPLPPMAPLGLVVY